MTFLPAIILCVSIFYYIVFTHIKVKFTPFSFLLLIIGTIIIPFLPTPLKFITAAIVSFYISKDLKSEFFDKKGSIHVLIFFYIIVISLTVTMRFFAFNNAMLDLGNMIQPIYNTGHGRFMLLSRSYGNVVRFSLHQEFIYLFFVPFVRIFPSAITILVIQTVLVGLSALAFYKICIFLNIERSISLIISMIFLLYIPVTYSNLAEVHGDTIAIFFISFAMLFYIRSKYIPFLIFSLLSMLCKEYIFLMFSLFALKIIFIDKDLKTGLSLLSLCIAYFLFNVLIIRALFPQSGVVTTAYYQKNIFDNIRNMFFPRKWMNIFFLFLPLLFTPFLKMKYLIPVIAIFAGIIVSKRPNMGDIHWHHWSTALPFFYTASILVINSDKMKRIRNRFKFLTIAFFVKYMLFFSIMAGPSPFSIRFWHPADFYFFNNESSFKITKYDMEVRKELRKYKDPELYISTTPNLAVYLALRENINLLLWGAYDRILDSDYVIYTEREYFLSKDRFDRMKRDIEFVENSPYFEKISEYPLLIYKNIKKDHTMD